MADLTNINFSPSGRYDLGTVNGRVGNIYCTAGAVTQATSTATGVTLDATSGVVTMFAGSIAALGSATFTVTNATVTANSAVTVCVCSFAGTEFTNGNPVAKVNNVVAGAFDIRVCNLHASNATGANAIKVAFEVAG